MRLHGVFGFLAVLKAADAATADEWRSRTIYQVMTDRFSRPDGSVTAPCNTTEGFYCGGTWQGIINKLDYIQDMGFTAIWISPITAQLPQYTNDTSSYHGYWQQNIYELNDKFGTESDLLDLSKALHDRGMYFMVDIVANHMASDSNYTDVKYNIFQPFNNPSYYHLPYCSVYTAGANQQNCWLGDDIVPLADLRTEDADVQLLFNAWIAEQVSRYNIDGLRLDSAANINPSFFTTFCEAAGIFCMGEVYSGDVAEVCSYQEVMDSALNYPVYWTLTRAFSSTNGSMPDFAAEIGYVKDGCNDSTVLGSFSENHDVPRFPSYTDDLALAKNVISYTMLADGVPIIYEGQEQHLNGGDNPSNREAIWLSGYNQSSPLYPLITNLNALRSRAIEFSSNYTTYKNYVIYNTSTTIATRKGFRGNQIITVLTNDGSAGESRSFSLDPATSGFVANEMITDVISCTNATSNATGWFEVDIVAGLPRALYPALNLVGTSICVGEPTTYGPNPTSTAPPGPTSSKKSGAESTLGRYSAVHVVLGSLVIAMIQYIYI